MKIGPSVERNVAIKECEKLQKLDPIQRCYLYRCLIGYLRNNDKKMAEALEEHEQHILGNKQDR